MLEFRKAVPGDADLLFEWANDETVRANSFNREKILYDNHISWFEKKVYDQSQLFLIFLAEEVPVGQVRFSIEGGEAIIGILVDKNHRGKGLSVPMLEMACGEFHKQHPSMPVLAYVKTANLASYKAFIKAGFSLVETVLYNGKDESFKLVKHK